MNNRLVKTGVLKVTAITLIMMCAAVAHAQQADAQKQKQSDNAPAMGKMQKKVLAKQKAEEKQAEKDRQEALKQHMKNQTPAVRKRMKADAHQANLYNEHKREFFLKRWFTKKKP